MNVVEIMNATDNFIQNLHYMFSLLLTLVMGFVLVRPPSVFSFSALYTSPEEIVPNNHVRRMASLQSTGQHTHESPSSLGADTSQLIQTWDARIYIGKGH